MLHKSFVLPTPGSIFLYAAWDLNKSSRDESLCMHADNDARGGGCILVGGWFDEIQDTAN